MNRDKGREILKIEAEAVLSLAGRLGKEFDAAIDAIVSGKGHLVVTGMGKAGLVGQKISATFASTGTPSIFLHPAEAYHGDLGRVLATDVVLAISNSGETEEVARLLDLPCGHGRVMRYLRAAFPRAEITGCDLLRDGVDHCAARHRS